MGRQMGSDGFRSQAEAGAQDSRLRRQNSYVNAHPVVHDRSLRPLPPANDLCDDGIDVYKISEIHHVL